jgi:undecaprenyl diphosphate synthase
MQVLPAHIGIVMDGNRTWASARGLGPTEAYRAGCRSIASVVREAARREVRAITLYTFSVDNWQRPSHEVHAIFTALSELLTEEAQPLADAGVELCMLGVPRGLPEQLRSAFAAAAALAPTDPCLRVGFAVNYGGREDILAAVQQLAGEIERGQRTTASLTARDLETHLWTNALPPLDLIIRTAGQHRLSNFLLWQAAYAELLFVDTLWPDFGPEAFARCLESYGQRVRRFGR